jgi:L-lactate dehydrogenase
MAHPTTHSIAIIGAGSVGGAIAFALLLRAAAPLILLVDTDAARRDGQALDLADAAHAGAAGVRVRAGTHEEAGKCDIIVVTAGAKQKPGNLYNPSPFSFYFFWKG